MNLDSLFNEALPLSSAFNQLIAPMLGDFTATTAALEDACGQATDGYSSVICAPGMTSPDRAAIDGVAAVIECYDALTVETLRFGYQRIHKAKSLIKSKRPGPPDGDVSMTTGFIVARNSELTLEQIADEMVQLNRTSPSGSWPDVVAVLSKGIVNYTAQVPGNEGMGDFLIPAQSSADQQPAPSLYISMMIRAAGRLTFNKVASLIMIRVSIYQPGTSIPDYRPLLEEIPKHGLAVQPYQFNLGNSLVAVTPDQAMASRMPRDIHHIVSGGKSLGSVAFEPWQDGGVLIVTGGFPMDLFLVFLHQVVPAVSLSTAHFFRNADYQVTYVLPINRQSFVQTLREFERRSSNISIRIDQSKILIKHMADEGTGSPFIARLMLGVLRMRDALNYRRLERDQFDERYELVLSGLRDVREASRVIGETWRLHEAQVSSGALVRSSGRKVQISENIDRQLKRELDAFLNAAVRTMKLSMQALTKSLQVDIGFLFAKASAYERGIECCRLSDPELADYLASSRLWTEPLIMARNNLEHGSVGAPHVTYAIDADVVRAGVPKFEGVSVIDFTLEGFNRISCFVEELTIYCLKRKLPVSLDVTEIPLRERTERAPERFALTVAPGGKPRWSLAAHLNPFEQV